MKRIILSAATLAVATFTPAPAATVGHTFTGVTAPDFAFPAELLAEFPAGTAWTLRVEWDDAAAATNPTSTQAGYALTKLTLTLRGKSGPWTTSSVSTNRAFNMNKNGSNHEIQFTSGWGPADHTNQTLSGSVQPYSINLTLGDPTGTAIPALTPAPKTVDLAKWSQDSSKSYFKFYLNNMGSQYLLGTLNFTIPPQNPDIEVILKKPLTAGKSTVAFAKTKVGGTAESKTLIVRNTGKGPLKNLALKVSGSARKDFKAGKIAKTTLAPGAKTTVKVTFKPKKTGSRKARLTITSNDPDENPFGIALKGTGK